MRFKTLQVVVAAIGLWPMYAVAQTAAPTQGWQYPVIKGYGKAQLVPHGVVRPDTKTQYKVIFSVTQDAAKPGDVNPGLDHVARLINVYALAGVPLKHLSLVAVVAGPATHAVLDSAHYSALAGVNNPNLDLIRQLKKAGVTIYVCGQALAEHSFQEEWVTPEVTLAMSALTVLPTYELKGYALLPY